MACPLLPTALLVGLKAVELERCWQWIAGSAIPYTLLAARSVVINIFVESPTASETAEAAFEVVYQGSRRVSLLTGGGKASPKQDIMVDMRERIGGICKIRLLEAVSGKGRAEQKGRS